ncbi:MAG: 4-phosphoerythronate dehydrogenase [Porticoccaceae bacterium]|nr:4-phosphoerythronate dehydrogenase [Porticoccaceae bacterium]
MLMVDELFGRLGTIDYIPGREISAADVADADMLLVRSVTRVDQALLEGSSVTFVGSATIGTDHVDQAYLKQQGIRFAHAPGCNANGVVQYVLSVLCNLQPDWLNCTVGIVGCGNVGGRLYRTLRSLGVSCQVYDPFLNLADNSDLVEFESLLGADIICVHTPLTTEGEFPTEHLFNRDVLARLGEDCLLINAGRGAVVDNGALLELLENGSGLRVALDVWEPEPNINCQLLERVLMATPHIAGYSREGKIRGTEMLAEDFYQWCEAAGEYRAISEQSSAVTTKGQNLFEFILAAYDVADDDRRLREAVLNKSEQIDSVALSFDRLRKEYPQRHEFSYFSAEFSGSDDSGEILEQARLLGFI